MNPQLIKEEKQLASPSYLSPTLKKRLPSYERVAHFVYENREKSWDAIGKKLGIGPNSAYWQTMRVGYCKPRVDEFQFIKKAKKLLAYKKKPTEKMIHIAKRLGMSNYIVGKLFKKFKLEKPISKTDFLLGKGLAYCRICKRNRNVLNFFWDNHYDRPQTECKECASKRISRYMTKRYKSDPDYRARYKAPEYRKKRRDYMRAYYYKNK
jgi:hypothetical protein